MSYTYLQEQGGVSSAESFSDIPQYVLLKLNLTAEKSYCSDNETESCQSSQSGMTSKLLTENPGEEKLMLSAEDSHAKISARLEKGKELMGNDLDYGMNLPGSLAKYDPHLYLWKTAQRSLFGGLETFSETWPNWGIMLNGESFPLPMPELLMKEKEFGYWPTPTKWEEKYISSPSPGDHYHGIGWIFRNQLNLMPNPKFYESLMAWPIGWTDLQPLAMDKFRQWLQWHGIS